MYLVVEVSMNMAEYPTLNGNAIKNVHIFWEPFPKQDSFNHINLKL